MRRSSARQSRRASFEADTRLFAVSISDEEDEGSRYRRRHETQPSHSSLLPPGGAATAGGEKEHGHGHN